MVQRGPLVSAACYASSMRYLLLALLIVSTCACSSCVPGQVVKDQGIVLAQCLPTAVAQILACSSRHDHACVLLAVTTLVACVATNQPAPANPPQQPPADATARREQHPPTDDPRNYAASVDTRVHVGPRPGAEFHVLSPSDVSRLLSAIAPTANDTARCAPNAAPAMNCASSSCDSNASL